MFIIACCFSLCVRDLRRSWTRSGRWSKCHTQSAHKHNDVQGWLFVTNHGQTLTLTLMDTPEVRVRVWSLNHSPTMKDGDKIYAAIRGTGVNQDGRTAAFFGPLRRANWLIKTNAKMISQGRTLSWLKLGTGTAIGDPTEISALAAALGKMPSGRRRYISSVKGNIGHQEAGAGIVGNSRRAFIKGFCPSTG